MTDYEEGARVEVFDPDRDGWYPGTVQDIAQTPMGSIIVVRSDHEIEFDLPLMWAVPVRAVDKLLRPLPAEPRQHVPVDCWCGHSRGTQ